MTDNKSTTWRLPDSVSRAGVVVIPKAKKTRTMFKTNDTG